MARRKETTYSEAKSESELFDSTEISITIGDDAYQALMESKNLLHDLVKKKFGCVSYLTGPASLTTQTSSVHPMVVYRKRLEKELQLSVWKDDLTKHVADALVNAANENLEHIGGLAFALATAGGKEIERESEQWIAQHGKVSTGKIAITTGGKLDCKMIIHAVGPIWSSYTESTCKRELQSAIIEILTFVNSSRIGSVAIPALSSGIFGFPLELCAATIVNTIKDFCQNVQISPDVKSIRLVNHDDKTVTAMKQACEEIFGSSDDSSSRQNSAQPLNQVFDSIVVNGLCLQLLKGRIENQQTTVIVNSSSETLDLSEGRISEAILKKGGVSLQQELCRKAHSSRSRSLICTRGHGLDCNYIYHILWPKIRPTEENLREMVVDCLKLAQTYRTPSISFPALGTGVLNFSKDRVAHIMTTAVLDFANRCHDRKLDVHFVIYPFDDDTFKAFQHALNSARAQPKIYETSQKRPNDTVNLSYFSGGEKRAHDSDVLAIRICGKDHASVSAVETWIRKTLLPVQECLFIEDQHILYCGKQELEVLSSQCDGVSISLILSNQSAKIEFAGLPGNAIKAILHAERVLCDVHDKYARKQEEELLHSVVLWTYSGKHATVYGAAANRTLEEAFIARKDVEVEVNGTFHTTKFNNKTVTNSMGQTFQLDRKCILEYDYLQKIQRDPMGSAVSYSKVLVELSTQEFQDRTKEFEKANLQIVKMEKIQNAILMALYQSRKDAVQTKLGHKNVLHRLYQEVPAQFCDFVCRVGFQRVYAQPEEQKYGAGLYFFSNLKKFTGARKKSFQADDLICILQAEVVTGQHTVGKRFDVVPRMIGSDCTNLYDSFVDDDRDPETFVIFNSSQANPQYLFTCKWK